MNRFTYIIILIVLLSSCNTLEIIDNNTTYTQEIKISTYVGESATRGIALNNNTFNREKQTFHLYATSLDNTNTSYTIADGITTYKDSKWQLGEYDNTDTWQTGHTMYWPTSEATVDFYGWTPTTLTRPTTVHSGQIAELSYDTNCGNYPPVDNANSMDITLYKHNSDIIHKTSNSNLGLQDDVMYVIKTGVKNPTQQSVDGEVVNTQVQLQFKHLLTNLKFEYKTEKNIKVRIKAMTIHNISSVGKWSYYGEDNNGWSITDNKPNYHSIPLTYGNSEFISAEDNAVKISAENDLMILPQSVTAWNPSQDGVTYTIAWNDGVLDGEYAYLNSYLRIYCDIATTNDILLFGDNIVTSGDSFTMPSEYCIYVPISSSDGTNELWKSGNQVTYRLTFGGGYSQNAEEVLQPITVTPKVTNWNDMGEVGEIK